MHLRASRLQSPNRCTQGTSSRVAFIQIEQDQATVGGQPPSTIAVDHEPKTIHEDAPVAELAIERNVRSRGNGLTRRSQGLLHRSSNRGAQMGMPIRQRCLGIGVRSATSRPAIIKAVVSQDASVPNSQNPTKSTPALPVSEREV